MKHEQDAAGKIIAQLERGVTEMDTTIVASLATARDRATAAALAAQSAPSEEVLHGGVLRHFSAHLHGRHAWMVTAALLATIALALLALQNSVQRTPVETDTLLLASELPPEAYVDKGFHAWLEDSSQL